MTDHVRIAKSNGVLTLTLNRPEKKNALTPEMYRTLAAAVDGAGDDPEVRCILIDAEGDMFTAGNDIAEFADRNAAPPSDEPSAGFVFIDAIARARKPLVAAVHARAIGIGVTMLMHCDLVFIAEDALLSTPFVNLALVPEAASSRELPSRIGHVRAFSMFVLGGAVDGRTAAAWGIANAALPAGEVRARARAAAEAVASRPPAAVAATKALMRDTDGLIAHVQREADEFRVRLGSSEAAEAFAAFREKRKPDFSKVPA